MYKRGETNMSKTELKDYLVAKYQETDNYLDMVISSNTGAHPCHDSVFYGLLGTRTTLNYIIEYLNHDGNIDFLTSHLEDEYKRLFK